MKKLHSILALLAALMMLLAVGCDDDSDSDDGDLWKTRLNGTVSGTKTLVASDSPYFIDEDLIVPEGATLEIEPGVVVYADTNRKVEVFGTLNAIGLEDNFIHFSTAKEPRGKGDWKGILLHGSDNSVLEYVRVSYAAKYNIVEDTSRTNDNGVARIDTVLHRGAITIRDCSPTIKRCIVDNAGYDGIHVVGPDASPMIIHNSLVLNAFNGIRVEPDWTLGDNTFGSPTIKSNIIVENDDAGIRMPSINFQEINVPEIMYNNIWNNASPNYVPLEIGNLVETDVHLNPEFIDIDELDLHLHPCSGALDKGDPDDPTDPDGTTADVGVFPYFQASNSLSHTLEGVELHLTTDYEFYEVTCDVTIAEGDTLYIDPGVEIRFLENFGFVVKGAIKALGTSSQPILFTSGRENPQRGDWLQLRLENVNSESRLEHVIIEYGSVDDFATPRFLGALSLTGSSPVIRNVTIDKSFRAGIYCNDGSSPDIEGLTITDAKEAGIYITSNSNPSVKNTKIIGVEGYAAYINLNSDPDFDNVLMRDFTVSGVVVEYYSNPTFDHITVHGASDFGFRVTETCSPSVKNSIISHYSRSGATANISSFPTFDYCNLYNDESAPKYIGTVILTNEVEGDPGFDADLNISPSGPCAGAGDDGSDLGYNG